MQQKPNRKQQNKVVGNQGELICANYLKRKGFTLIEMNYLRKWGEIDVIVKKDNKIHFVEVKTVSYETKADLERAVTHGTWRPEENVHAFKIKKLSRAIESWIMDRKWDGDWQIDVAAVRIVPRETFATIKIIDNVILG
ncbi:MAG: YraN family protein [Patescibacteria group bacterium]